MGDDDFLVSDTGNWGFAQYEAGSPRVVFSSVTETYLVTWYGDDRVGGLVDDEYEVFGQFVARDGTMPGPNDFRISDMGGTGDVSFAGEAPSVAVGRGSDYLVVWQGDDDVGGLQDEEIEIFGQRVERPVLVFADGFEFGDGSAWTLMTP